METAVRRLYRSRRNRVFAGICGGLAEYLGWDAVLVRVAYIILTLLSFGAAGILLYIFGWVFIPLEDEQAPGNFEERAPRPSSRTAIGVIIVIIGAIALLDSFMPWFWHMFSFHVVASVVLIALGLMMIFWKTQEREPVVAPAAAPLETDQPPFNPPPPPLSASPTRRLVRLQRGRKIAGVCAGLGQYFGMDPTLVRLLFVALLFLGGSGLLLYIILWLVMPLEIT